MRSWQTAHPCHATARSPPALLTLQEVPRRRPSRFQVRLCSWSPWESRTVGIKQGQGQDKAGSLLQAGQEASLSHPEYFPGEMIWPFQRAGGSQDPAGHCCVCAGSIPVLLAAGYKEQEPWERPLLPPISSPRHSG